MRASKARIDALGPARPGDQEGYLARVRLAALEAQVEEGDGGAATPPVFDPPARDLWRARESLRGVSREEAEARYVREAEALLRSAPAAMAASSDTPPAASGGQRPPRPAAAPSPVATSAPGTPRVGTPAAGAASPRAGAPETPPGGALLGLDKRGKLKKQRDIFRGWRERYFVLDGKMLWYYESKSEHYPKGSIYLESDCEVIPWPEGRKGDARKLFTFRICHPPSKLEYRLGADSQEEMDSWIDALSRAIHAEPPTPDAVASAGRPRSLRRSASAALTPQSRLGEDGASPRHAGRTGGAARARSPMVRAAGGAGGASGTGGGGGGAAAATPTTVADSGSSEDEPATVSWREPATVPPQWSKAITKAFATMAALSRDDAPQWKFNFESEGVRCSVGRGDKPAARGDGIVPLPPRALFETITDFSRKREIDPQYEDGRVVEELNDQGRIDYLLYKRVWPTSARDFCLASQWRVARDGTITVVATSVDHPGCPEVDGNVRADLEVGGWVLRPHGRDGMSTKVTYLVIMDLMGSLPTSIVRKVTSQQPMLVDVVRKAVLKTYNAAHYKEVGPLTNLGAEVQVPAPRSSQRKPRGAPRGGAPRAAAAAGAGARGDAAGDATDGASPASAAAGAAGNTQAARQAGDADAPAAEGAAKMAEMPDIPPPLEPPRRGGFLAFLGVLVALALVPASYYATPNTLDRRLVATATCIFVLRYLLNSMVGHHPMSTRRKLMISTWDAPSVGNILGTLDVDAEAATEYIARKRKETGQKITITHVVMRAIALGIRAAPAFNGRIVFGRFVPHDTIDVSCLVFTERTGPDGKKFKDLANAKIANADRKSVVDIATELGDKAGKIRAGKDADFEKSKPLLRALPTWALSRITRLVGFLGAQIGLNIGFLGVKAFPFGSCMITSVGMMGLDMAFAPHTPFAHVPMLLTIGAVRDRVVAEAGRPVVRKRLMITATIDHRYVDGAHAAILARVVRAMVKNPDEMDKH